MYDDDMELDIIYATEEDEDFEVIYTYSRADAINDGVLVDVGEMGEEAGYKYPVAITNTVDNLITAADENTQTLSDYKGILWDILWMSIHYHVKEIDESTMMFEVEIDSRVHRMKVNCGPGDNLDPVITIMLENED